MASGSRLKPAKTQILRLGSFKEIPVPARFQNFIVENLKIYGILITNAGVENVENWTKCGTSVENLKNRFPPNGFSSLGKMHFVYTYFLCFFNYVLRVGTPPDALVVNMYRAISRFLWFPSRSNIIKRDILLLDTEDGGIGFPNEK